MNDRHQKLEPTRFELGQGEASSTSPESGAALGKTNLSESNGLSQRVIFAALAGLLALAAAVFFWLPKLVSEPSIDLPKPQVTVTKKLPGTEISPWSDAQLLRQRKAAQDVSARLLEEQFNLEELGVEQWASEPFGMAVERATKGDELYRQQAFFAATEAYQSGLNAMLKIAREVPAIFEQHLQQGLSALQNDNAPLATTALQLAQLIQPDSAEVAHALGRAKNLEQVLALVEQAAQARRERDLDSTAQLLTAAVALDPEHQSVQAELIAVKRDIAKRDFNRAMTEGYEALDKNDFDLAESRFLAARRIMPGAQETQSALQQTRTSQTRTQIDELSKLAQRTETAEDWPKAIAHYQAILNIDETVVFARSGLIRSKARADLDQRLQQIIAQPQRLAEDRVYNDAQSTWREGSGVEQADPKLQGQLEQVRVQLNVARTPVPILLQSDELTQVTVYKVAKLGAFRRQQLKLKPGNYTAIGIRSGFRDVRKQFTVAPDKSNPVIEISCTEPI